MFSSAVLTVTAVASVVKDDVEYTSLEVEEPNEASLELEPVTLATEKACVDPLETKAEFPSDDNVDKMPIPPEAVAEELK